MQLKRYGDAKAELEALSKLQPDKPGVHFLLARVYGELGDRQALSAELDRVLELAPDNKEALLVKARLLIVEKRFDDAEAMLAKLEKGANAPSTLGTRLLLERARGNAKAEAEVARALFKQHPASATVIALAMRSAAMGITRRPRSNWKSGLLRTRRTWALSVPWRNAIWEAARRHRPCHLKQIIAAAPNDVLALNNLAWAMRITDPAQALDYAARANKLAPDAVTVLDTYAEVLARNGQKDKALWAIDRAIEKSNGSPALKFRRAQINDLVGNRTAAVEELKALVKGDAPKAVKDAAEALLAKWGGGAAGP